MDKFFKYRKFHPCPDCSKPIRDDHKRCAQCFFKWKKFPIRILFWRHVEKTDGCWLWQASLNQSGYGQCAGKGAHRVSWEIHKGDIADNLMVCHSCDNPSCVNPEHLFLATHQQNMKDRNNKGRNVHGEVHPMRKLTRSIIKFIRMTKKPTKELARRFNVNSSTINRIRNKSLWK